MGKKMKQPTEKELRKLDVWIARHVMGLRVELKNDMFDDLRCWRYTDEGRPDSFNPKFEPTTNGADAAMVLEKCAEKDTIVITKSTITELPWVIVTRKASIRSCYETFPIAICKLAKRLFTK